MCLTSKHYFAKIALKNIPCYKVVTINEYGNFVTPIMEYELPSTILSGSEYLVANSDIVRWRIDENTEIYSGVIHTCSSVEDAKDLIDKQSPFIGFKKYYHIYECIIPQFTRYFSSIDGSMYASKKIKFIREIE